jgi:deferrochelatase/peroxidase EfeB
VRNRAQARTADRRRIDRRAFLLGATLVAGAGGSLVGAATVPPALSNQSRASSAPISFHGTHQAGVLRRQPRRTVMCAFDVLAAGRAELVEVLRTITDRARRLTAGGIDPPAGISAPPSDPGILGPDAPPGGLTVTVGVGDSLFDERYGLGDRRPARLTRMPIFPNDRLDSGQCHGDLSVQLSADDEDIVINALRDVARQTRGAMQLRWRIDGFVSPPRPAGTPRNLMGFKDGISNPDVRDPEEMRRLVWVAGGGEPAWTAGGTYLVVRLIRMLTEFWDRISIAEQEQIFGRRRDSGAPLDGMREEDQPNFPQDPTGAVIPLTSHIRLANPRTQQTATSRILRRAYNYDRGLDQVGNLDMGLLFTCYQ